MFLDFFVFVRQDELSINWVNENAKMSQSTNYPESIWSNEWLVISEVPPCWSWTEICQQVGLTINRLQIPQNNFSFIWQKWDYYFWIFKFSINICGIEKDMALSRETIIFLSNSLKEKKYNNYWIPNHIWDGATLNALMAIFIQGSKLWECLSSRLWFTKNPS